MPRFWRGACFFLLLSALACRTPQQGQITDDKNTSSGGSPAVGEASVNKRENKDTWSAGSPPAGTAPTDEVKPSVVASHTPDQAGPVQTIRETTPRHKPKESKAIISTTLPASDLALAKETVQRARLFERNLQGRWYPVKTRCTRAIAHRLIDAWGHQMDIDCQLKEEGLVIRSAGPDGVFFSADDVQWIGNPRPML